MTGRHQQERDIIGEAAVWLARLRSDERQADVHEAFRHWLDASQEHRAAFETVNDAWDLAGGVRLQPQAVDAQRRGRRIPALVACMALLAGLMAWQVTGRGPTFATEVGERRVLALDEGSVVTLNTDTRLSLRFSDDQRLVLLDGGEASFDVAKDTLRPFVVKAGEAKVVAVGTAFDVRWVDGALDVTLAEGEVRVVERDAAGVTREIKLDPGQRLSDRRGSRPVLKRVDLESARAWRSGQLVFDDVPLTEAVAEVNRYSEHKIRIEGRGAERVQISGVFEPGGSAKFARALGDLYGFEVREQDAAIVIGPAAD